MHLNCATAKDVLKTVKDEDVQMVDLRFTDLPGVWQHFSVPPSAVDPVALEDPRAAGQVERGVDHRPGAGDDVVLAREDLHRPLHPVVDAARPLVAHAVQVGRHRFEVDPHLGDVVLHLRVVRHRPRRGERPALVHLGGGATSP